MSQLFRDPTGRLRHEILEQERKGVARWLLKYVRVLNDRAGLSFSFQHRWWKACIGALRTPPCSTEQDWDGRPRLGVLDFHPIQYHAPLYRLLAQRRHVDLGVLFLRPYGERSYIDPGFGVPVAWNVDLLSGYDSRFLPTVGRGPRRLLTLARWIHAREVIVIHGHSDYWMLLAALVCRILRTPYLLRGDAAPESQSAGLRRAARELVAYAVVSRSAGGLAVGELNAAFYRKYRAPSVTTAPHSVDNERFGQEPAERGADLLSRLGLPSDGRPVVMFCGKFQPNKRPLDIIAAAGRLERQVTLLFVGDGPLAEQARAALQPGQGVVTGFVNQAELPSYYHAADILVLPSEAETWGLVVNEAMAAGTLPVVSAGVRSGPDLVAGLGEVFPSGDVTALAAALDRALDRLAEPDLAKRIRERIDRYGIEATAAGFERAARQARSPRMPARPLCVRIR